MSPRVPVVPDAGDRQRTAGVGRRAHRCAVVRTRAGIPQALAGVTGAQPVEYLTVADVAAELSVNVSQVRTLIRIGSLPATRNRRGHWLIERQMLKRWISDTYAETRRFVLEHDPSGRWARQRMGSVDDACRPPTAR